MSGFFKPYGIPVAKVTENEAVEKIIELAKTPRRPPHTVATLNVDFVCNAVGIWPFEGYPELWEYLKHTDFVVADGMPIVWGSRLMRNPLPERVAGADLVPKVCKRCAEEGLSVYVVGATDAVLHKAFAILRETSPDLKIAGMNTSEIRLEADHGTLIQHINESKADVLFVALGNPKQEIWICRNGPKLEVGVLMGVGGSFNFIAGTVKRAPKWMRDHGLEWVHRISQEPKRLWKRYVYGLVKFSWLTLHMMLHGGGKE